MRVAARATALALILSAGGAFTLAATESAAGNITGRIQNIVTSNYLNNARVALKGTGIVTFTDQFGIYRLNNIPAGPIVLEVFYTGLDPQEVSLTVAPGRTTERDVDLTSGTFRGAAEDTVRLSAFTVAATRETNVEAIAINEQRFASNIKNVVATNAFGDVVDGSMGEFLKYLPGISTDYSDVEIVGVSVRGLGSNLTAVSTDGAQTASANFQGASRTYQFLQVPVNNVSRIELTKVPTPETPADAMGGSVNMISKSAFERKGAELRYRFYVAANSENLTLRKTPHPFEKYTRKVLPGFDFDYTLPLTKDFGLVLVGMSSNQYNEQHSTSTTWSTGGTGTGASLGKPFLQSFSLRDGPRYSHRNSLNLKADWRVTPSSVLSVNAMISHLGVNFGNQSWIFNTGAIGTPSVAGGVGMSFGEDFTRGATGRGSVQMGGGFTDFFGVTKGGSVRYRFDNGTWKVDAGASPSSSKIYFRDISKGHFTILGVANRVPVRVEYGRITPDFPGQIGVYDNSGQAVDIYDINSYRLATASVGTRDMRDDLMVGDLNVTRRVDAFSFPLSLQAGARHRAQVRDINFSQDVSDYAGPAGNIAAVQTPAPYLSKVYARQDSHYGFRNIPWVSPHLAWDDYVANPAMFTQSTVRTVQSAAYWRQRSEYIKEQVAAGYLQAQGRFFRNRLNVVTGVRFERTTVDGRGHLADPGAAFVRNADGNFVLTAAGARIRKPEAGATGSMEELNLTSRARGLRTEKSYDGFYPSLHLTHHVSENLLARLAYAHTYGRPNFNEIIPNATFSQNVLTEEQYDDPAQVRGLITVRNPNLKPWTADNFDLSLEYYTPQGGLFSAGAFLKEIKDFFGSQVKLATVAELEELGLDPIYVGWNVSTKFNSGNARISGVEFSVKHSLAPLGGWGRHFTAFVNGTQLHLAGDRLADFSGFISRSGSWGLTFSRRPVILMAKWSLRGRQKLGAQPAFGPDAFLYGRARTYLDANLDWQAGKRLTLFVNARNMLNEPQTNDAYGAQTPGYARRSYSSEYGIQFSAGIKGTY